MNAVNAVVAVIVIAFVLSVILALPIMWLWDWLMPAIFGLKEITLMQAWGLSLLCSLLFKNNTTTSSK